MEGSTSVRLDALLQRHGADHWAFLTAWNPASVALSREQNDKRQHELERHTAAAGYTLLRGEGVGEDPQQPREESFLILGMNRRHAVATGRLFGQLAIVAGRRGTPARLLPCGGGHRLTA